MSANDHERRAAEIALMEAMYPEEASFNERSSEFKYTPKDATLTLRLPDDYPSQSVPSVLSAQCGPQKTDVRESMREKLARMQAGDELLDMIVNVFNEVVDERRQQSKLKRGDHEVQNGDRTQVGIDGDEAKLTVVVWLHHLLNTGKRKQVLNPPSPAISGVSKPGHPGVLVFAGPSTAVHEHVNGLRQLNWQAFQMRLEADEEWTFDHGKGVKEVETMGDLVKEIGERKKSVFMEAMRMK